MLFLPTPARRSSRRAGDFCAPARENRACRGPRQIGAEEESVGAQAPSPAMDASPAGEGACAPSSADFWELSIWSARNILRKGCGIPMPKNPTHRKSFASVILLVVVLAGTFAAAGALASQLRVSKMGGDIDYADVPDGGSFSTIGGNVHLGKVHNDVTVSTMGGNITIDSADAYVKASTMGGNVTVGSAEAVDASTMGGNVEATVLKGDSNAAHNVTLSSMGGEIIVTLPKDYPMTIDVQLAYTKNKEGQYKITE